MPLLPGDMAPWFKARTQDNPNVKFDNLGGRYIVLCFLGSAGRPESQRILQDLQRATGRFDGANFAFIGVSTDPEDERANRFPAAAGGVGWFFDFDGTVSRRYGAMSGEGEAVDYQPHTLVLDPALRALGVLAIDRQAPENHFPRLLEFLAAVPPLASRPPLAPVLFAPHVFEPAFCRALIYQYERQGGVDSGFMREVGGKTVGIHDYQYKRRMDYEIVDQEIIRQIHARLSRRLLPEIRKAFQFEVTKIERHLVACYDAATACHFRAHRDNTTPATAHRRFAVTINLNADEYMGGDLRFPEFTNHTFRVPTGGAIVFSCSLLHEVTVMTQGKRYAFLPFLHDGTPAVQPMTAAPAPAHSDLPTIQLAEPRSQE